MKKKFLRFRFSVRSLVVIVTLNAIALAAWAGLKQKACDDVAAHAYSKTWDMLEDKLPNFGRFLRRADRNSEEGQGFAMPSSPMPYIVAVWQVDPGEIDISNSRMLGGRKYYFWLIGLMLRLPYEGTSLFDGESDGR